MLFYILCGLGAAVLHTAINYWQVHDATNLLLQKGASISDIQSILSSSNPFYVDPDANTLSTSFKFPVVGASGAIYGLLVAFAFMFPNAGLSLMFIPVPVKAKYFVPGILVLDLVLGFGGSSFFGGGGTGIAHFAHRWCYCRLLLMWKWKKNQFDQYRWN